ncbi:hypothetical protein BsWGS_25905 [Bradybaena similaris]
MCHLSQVYKPSCQAARRPLVYVTRRVPQPGLDVLLKVCNVKQWDSELAVPHGELLASVAGVHGIMCLPSDAITAQVLNAAGRELRVVATMSDDSKHVDVEECHRRGIHVVTCCFRPVEVLAELTISLALLTIKESQTEEELQRLWDLHLPDLISSGPEVLQWENKSSPLFRKRLAQQELSFHYVGGKPGNTESLTWKQITKMTFGVYGLTKLGKRVASILKNIGIVNILVSDAEKIATNGDKSQSDYKFVSLDDFLQNSDVICVCGSECENSRELFSRESLEKMKKQAILVVSHSQERAVNYTDLYTALRDGRIKAAGLNDCNQKPVPYKPLFMGLRNCTFLPQSQEGVHDIRDKVCVGVSKSLADALSLKRSQKIED